MYISQYTSHLRIFNTYCIFADDYHISSNRRPRLVLYTWHVFETSSCYYSEVGLPMRECKWLLLVLSHHGCHSFQRWCGPCCTSSSSSSSSCSSCSSCSCSCNNNMQSQCRNSDLCPFPRYAPLNTTVFQSAFSLVIFCKQKELELVATCKYFTIMITKYLYLIPQRSSLQLTNTN